MENRQRPIKFSAWDKRVERIRHAYDILTDGYLVPEQYIWCKPLGAKWQLIHQKKGELIGFRSNYDSVRAKTLNALIRKIIRLTNKGEKLI